jgi:hypothetical protein
LTSTRAVISWMKCIGSLLPEYLDAAWLMSSMVCHVERPSEVLLCEERKSSMWDWRARKACQSELGRLLAFRRSRSCVTMRAVLGRTWG